MRRVLRVLAWVMFSALLVAVAGAIALVIWARSPSGRRRILSLVVSSIEKRVQGRVTIAGLEGGLLRELTLRDVRIYDQEGPAISAGEIHARYDLRGLWSRQLRIESLSVTGARVQRPIQFVKQEKSGSLEVVIESFRAEAEIDGNQQTGPLHATLRASGKLESLTAELVVTAAHGELRVKAQGSPASWRATAQAHQLQLRAGRVELAANAQGNQRGGTVAIERLKLDAAGAHALAHGSVDFGAALSGDVRAEVSASDLTQLGVAGLHGKLEARVHLQRNQEQSHLDATVKARHLELGPLRVASLQLHAHGGPREIVIDQLSLGRDWHLSEPGRISREHARLAIHSGRQTLTVDGNRGVFEVKGRHLDVHSLGDLPSTQLDLDAHVAGRNVSLRLNGRTQEWRRLPAITVALDASLHQGHRIRATLSARLHGDEILTAQAESTIANHWRETPITVAATIPSFELRQLGGTLTGLAQVSGTLGHPSLAATLDVQARGTLHLEAQLPAGQPLQARLQMHELAIALEEVGGLRTLEGTLSSDLQLSHAKLSGSLKVDHGAFAAGSDPRRYHDLTIDLQAHDGNVELRRLALQAGDGKLSAHGKFAHDGLELTAIDLVAEADRFPFQRGNARAWIDARVTMQAERKDNVLQGKLVVEKGSAELPARRPGRALRSTAPLEDVVFVGEPEPKPRRAPFAADVIAHIPGPFSVQSPELSADLKGELDVRIADGEARLYGHAETRSGRVELLGRRYHIERARVSFDGSPDPALDVRITREVSHATVVIEVHGTLKNPDLVLASDPPIYDSAQVIGMIVSGNPDNLRVGSNDADLAGAISGILVNRILDGIAPNLPIDVLKIETSASFNASRLEIGKYLTERIYIAYVHQFGSEMSGLHRENSSEANLEYRFKRNYTLDVRYGDAGSGSVNLSWTLRR